MSVAEKKILDALLELDALVRRMASADPKPDLRPVFSRIDELTRQLPAGTDPELLHYLHKKSYEKAKLFLLGRDSESTPGQCRH